MIIIILYYYYICPRYNYLKIWNLRVQKKIYIEKIDFTFVQIKFLEMHITNQKVFMKFVKFLYI